MSYTLRSKNDDGTISELKLTAAQALDLGPGKAIAYTPRDERLLVDEDGQIIRRDSAIPQRPEAACARAYRLPTARLPEHRTGGHPRYCNEHLGDGAVIDAMENLGGRLEQLADQVERVARLLEDRVDRDRSRSAGSPST